MKFNYINKFNLLKNLRSFPIITIALYSLNGVSKVTNETNRFAESVSANSQSVNFSERIYSVGSCFPKPKQDSTNVIAWFCYKYVTQKRGSNHLTDTREIQYVSEECSTRTAVIPEFKEHFTDLGSETLLSVQKECEFLKKNKEELCNSSAQNDLEKKLCTNFGRAITPTLNYVEILKSRYKKWFQFFDL